MFPLWKLRYSNLINWIGMDYLPHTEKKDFDTPRLLQQMEQKLPAGSFMRIHKQFIVNLKYISHFQYYTGGRYLVFLGDSDETALPVSRKYAPLVKERFGL